MQQAVILSFIIGVLTASPIGPMGLLCLRRAFSLGFGSGIISALGISCAYSFWSFAAIYGLASFSYWIELEHRPLELAIGLFFLLYGLHAVFNRPRTDYPDLKRKGRLAEFFSTFLVVFLNPTTFIMFTALFALFGIAKKHSGLIDSLEIALSVFVGTVIFWIAASHTIHQVRSRIKDSILNRISQISAFAIMLFGITILVYSIQFTDVAG